MPQQLTLATQSDVGFEVHRKTTRREVFLAEMDKVVPWGELCVVLEPFYSKPRVDGGGRPTVGLERMLRIHFLQQWYALSDPGVEEALYDSTAMRRFVGSTWAAKVRRTRQPCSTAGAARAGRSTVCGRG